jgi:predicted lipoprotein with Yx(FWY)xxD motif
MKAPTTMPGIMGKFGVTMRAGAAQQLTYDGAPLYTFANDKKPGDINGQGIASTWWAVVARVSPRSSSTGSGSTGGY